MTSTRSRLILFILLLLASLPVILFRDFTPSNELRYLSIADEALQNGSFFAFTNHSIPYADKPPLFFWGIMTGKLLLGSHANWFLALLSFVPAVLILGILDRWIGCYLEPGRRLAALIMLATSAFFLGSALTLRMDMLMCLFIILAFRSFWIMWNNPDEWNKQRWLFPVYLFLAVFTKGPLGILIPLCGTAVFMALNGKIKTFFHYWGWSTWIPLLFLSCAWFGMVYIEGGRNYLDNLLFHQTIDRAVDSFHHKAPFYYYFIAIWYCIAPWSIFVVSVIIAYFRPTKTKNTLDGFLIVSGITTILLLSVISAKLQIYMLPAIPLLVYGALLVLPKNINSLIVKVPLGFPAVIFALAFPSLLIINHFFNPGITFSAFLISASIVMSLTGASTLYFLFKKSGNPGMSSAVVTLGGGFLITIFLAGCTVKSFNPLIGYREVAQKAKEISISTGVSDIKTWKISRAENMDVYLGAEVNIIPDTQTPELADEPYILILPESKAGEAGFSDYTTVSPYAIAIVK